MMGTRGFILLLGALTASCFVVARAPGAEGSGASIAAQGRSGQGLDPTYKISDRGRRDERAFPPPTKRVAVHGDATGELLAARFPECKEAYVNDCALDEVRIPCTNLCWRVCAANRYWDESAGECRHIPGYDGSVATIDAATRSCKRLHPDYRVPTLEEATSVVGNCREKKNAKFRDIQCEAYHDSAIYYVVDVGMYFDYAVDRPGRCVDGYGQERFGCAWLGRLDGGDIVLPSVFQFLYYHGGPGSTVTNALCVREFSSK